MSIAVRSPDETIVWFVWGNDVIEDRRLLVATGSIQFLLWPRISVFSGV